MIDAHPGARELLLARQTPAIYLAAEGCLNADALLSKGKAAISIPSVYMWPKTREEYRDKVARIRRAAAAARTKHRAAERRLREMRKSGEGVAPVAEQKKVDRAAARAKKLEHNLTIARLKAPLEEEARRHFADHADLLRAAPAVYVIPDADYLARNKPGPGVPPDFINRQVRAAIDGLYKVVKRLGVREAFFAVPPWLTEQAARKRRNEGWDIRDREKIGIGDHLAMGGNLEPRTSDNPDGVITTRYTTPIEKATDLPPLPRIRQDRARERDFQLLKYLAEDHGHQFGQFYPYQAGLVLDWSRDRVLDAWKRLVERGVLEVWPGKAVAQVWDDITNEPHDYMVYALTDRADWRRVRVSNAEFEVPEVPEVPGVPGVPDDPPSTRRR